MTSARTPSVWASNQPRFKAVNVLPSPMPAVLLQKSSTVPALPLARSLCVMNEIVRNRRSALRHRNQMRLDARCGYVIRDETLARAGLAASKVAPAARDTCPAGSAVPPDAYECAQWTLNFSPNVPAPY